MEQAAQQQQNQQTNDQQQQQQQQDGGSSGKGGFMNRQSSTRWTPTTDQIRILKDLYYNNGIRSPSAEQIQRISARLRQYGKIEGKNVFYWFQNHKARERQKKRFTSDHLPNPMQRPNSTWKPDQDPPLLHTTKYINIPSTGLSSAASSSSAEMVTVGQMGNFGYGSVPMEKSFRDCTISAGCSSGHVGSGINHHHHLGWVGHVDPYASAAAYANMFDKIRPSEEEEEEINDVHEIETLPLFPMHAEDIHQGYCNLKSSSNDASVGHGWYHHHHHHHHQQASASLELTLNSYTCISPDHYA